MYRILIADDEMIERMVLSKKLNRYFKDCIQIYNAENGLEAVKLFKRLFEENPIQIAILDINMPGMNGIDAAEQIRAADKNAVIIFLTAYDEFSYAKRAISIKVLEYLLKPCDDEELFLVVEEAMRQADLMGDISQNSAGNRTGHNTGISYDENNSLGEDTLREEELSEQGISRVAAKIYNYVRGHYMEEISMQDVARAMNYSDTYFCRLFKQCFDQNFTSYLTNLRMNEAKKLLQNKEANIKDVSSKVGYSDSKYFAKVFKRMFGMLPSEYRDGYNAQKQK